MYKNRPDLLALPKPLRHRLAKADRNQDEGMAQSVFSFVSSELNERAAKRESLFEHSPTGSETAVSSLSLENEKPPATNRGVTFSSEAPEVGR